MTKSDEFRKLTFLVLFFKKKNLRGGKKKKKKKLMAEFVDVASEADLQKRGRLCVEVGQRMVVLFARGRGASATYYALDSRCYHMGGNLKDAPIEELAGVLVVRCLWHSYRISLQTGETFGAGGEVVRRSDEERARWLRQRTHQVKAEHGRILVRVSRPSDPGAAALPSDHYQPELLENRRRMNLLLPSDCAALAVECQEDVGEDV